MNHLSQLHLFRKIQVKRSLPQDGLLKENGMENSEMHVLFFDKIFFFLYMKILTFLQVWNECVCFFFFFVIFCYFLFFYEFHLQPKIK